MQDDLKEAQAKIEQLNTTILHIGENTAEMAKQYRDRIATLEALVKEAGEALGLLLANFSAEPEGDGWYGDPVHDDDVRPARTTLARIKENSRD